MQESDEAVEHIRCRYRSLVSMCDRNLGRILDLMDEHDLWRDTMLIVGTDHGFLLGEHGWWAKNQMPYYNEVANNPLFIWDPRSGVKGERRQALVQMIDWAPTLYDFFNSQCRPMCRGNRWRKRSVTMNQYAARRCLVFSVVMLT